MEKWGTGTKGVDGEDGRGAYLAPNYIPRVSDVKIRAKLVPVAGAGQKVSRAHFVCYNRRVLVNVLPLLIANGAARRPFESIRFIPETI
jgi:hypothetical protein